MIYIMKTNLYYDLPGLLFQFYLALDPLINPFIPFSTEKANAMGRRVSLLICDCYDDHSVTQPPITDKYLQNPKYSVMLHNNSGPCVSQDWAKTFEKTKPNKTCLYLSL